MLHTSKLLINQLARRARLHSTILFPHLYSVLPSPKSPGPGIGPLDKQGMEPQEEDKLAKESIEEIGPEACNCYRSEYCYQASCTSDICRNNMNAIIKFLGPQMEGNKFITRPSFCFRWWLHQSKGKSLSFNLFDHERSLRRMLLHSQIGDENVSLDPFKDGVRDVGMDWNVIDTSETTEQRHSAALKLKEAKETLFRSILAIPGIRLQIPLLEDENSEDLSPDSILEGDDEEWQRVFQAAFGIGRADDPYWSFCNGKWERDSRVVHCETCERCRSFFHFH